MIHMKAKAALFLAALALPLSACGSVSQAGPSAGELLRTPTTLSLAGRTLSAEARPTLSGEQLSARVQVRSSASSLPLSAQSVYLVTQGGVWQAEGRWEASSCGAGCRVIEGRGPAQGLRPGENVQVVVRLQDSAGRHFWLRDDQSLVQKN
ncbi:hypothetical protein Deipr_0836 [Deinococcus proteolyticus MRP]|uniref:Lipoprotein n=1 Tax=Deinococcus proteolyticus (strain ATCC 35074 / DSM 20540 / JCM 6276 / NBRC 101906 / NCIMB 13154 / VKM Ac-1939 / CCM 2703 / MRP) TaxID=693977 RepID=F0RM72_DEIPM|nr:hypothetical protein [Deinococcus proteolyticus]ADY25992.1 hypothetical protein Deipr_0836 [Deinococcus proteolyticus MRP]